MKETQTKPQNTDNTLGSLSYYELRLKELLQTSFPNLLADAVFIKDRSEYAAQAYQEAFEAGISIPECDKIASGVLFDGLFFSPFDMVFEVISQEFDTQLADEDLRPFALKIFPELVPYFKKYENEIDEDFQHSAAYQSLYTELTGAIELWIEENGIS